MKFSPSLIPCILLKRYKRFLADVRLANGEIQTVYCPNTGAMTGCAIPNSPAWISDSQNVKRKYRYTLEIVEVEGVKICVNTQQANALVAEGIAARQILPYSHYQEYQKEKQWTTNVKARFDFYLFSPQDDQLPSEVYMEVKSVTLFGDQGIARFPDAITKRGQKHLLALQEVVKSGKQACLLFIVNRTDALGVRPAYEIDLKYAQLLRESSEQGVKIIAYGTEMDENEYRLTHPLPVDLNFIEN